MDRKKALRIVLFSLILVVVFTLAVLMLVNISIHGKPLPQNLFNSKKSGELIIEGKTNVPVGQKFSLKFKINAGNNNANAAGLYVFFDPMKINIMEMKTEKSFCQFYPEKKFDNRLGTLSLVCGSPHPGVKGENELVEVTFLSQAIGTSAIRVGGESKILLSDGKGTNILSNFPIVEVNSGAGF